MTAFPQAIVSHYRTGKLAASRPVCVEDDGGALLATVHSGVYGQVAPYEVDTDRAYTWLATTIDGEKIRQIHWAVNAAEILAEGAADAIGQSVPDGFIQTSPTAMVPTRDGLPIEGAEPITIPRGPKGDRGLDGVNAVENDTAVAGYLGAQTSQTWTALSAAIGRVTHPTSDVHTAHIQAAIDATVAAGIRRLELPPFSSFGAAMPEPWVVDGELVIPRDFYFDGSKARVKQTVINRPVFYVPPESERVTVEIGECYYGNPRPAIGDYGTGTVHGAPERAVFSGVMTQSQHGTFKGKFRGFRNGVRVGTVGNVGIRRGNRIDIEVDDVDFGLVYFDQDDFRAEVHGRYVQTPGTTEPGHLIYGTRPVDRNGVCVINGEAWDSDGGAAFFFRHPSMLVSESLVARNCSSVLNISNSNGDTKLGKVVGVGMTRTYSNAQGQPVYVEAVRGGTQPDDPTGADQGSVTIDSLRVDIAMGAAESGVYRAVSAYRDWTIKEYEITYRTSSLSSSASLIHAPTDRLTLGSGSITNLDSSGATGLRGINFNAGTGHALVAAPRITGCTTGVEIQEGVKGSFVVDEEIIETARPIDRKVIARSGAGVVVAGMGWARRINRWTAAPLAATTANATLNQNTLYALPRILESETVIDAVAITVVTARPGGIIRMGVYGDDRGAPGALIAELGTVDAATAGTTTLELASPLKLSRGPIYFGVVAQGASDIIVVGANGAAFDGSHPQPDAALSGRATAVGGISGALPSPFGVPVTSSTIGPRIAFRVQNPI